MIIFNFHGVGAPPPNIDPDEFDVWLSRSQLNDTLDLFVDHEDVQITFDDGNISDLTEALPALIERGLKATFFICAGRIGTRGYLDENQIFELRQAGMTIGSHGMNHVRWRKLNSSRLHTEIAEAKRILETVVQEPIEYAACPFGAYDRMCLRALRHERFARVFTSDGGPTKPDDWIQARNTVKRWDTRSTLAPLLVKPDQTSPPMVQQLKRWVKQQR